MAEKEVSTLSILLAKMELSAKAAISLETPDSEYVLHLDSQSCATCGDSAKVAASTTDKTVRLYTRSDLAYTSKVGGHEKQISDLKFSKNDSNTLYTSSTDGTLRCWDTREKCDKAARLFEGFEETSPLFTAFDVSCDGRVLCAGTEAKGDDVHLIFWDVRKSESLGVYSESHQDDITNVRFHPASHDRLLTGSMDGLVCVFDLAETSEDDALQATLNTEAMVSRCGWSGPRDEMIYTTTTNNSLHMWDSVEYDPVLEISDINSTCPGKERMDYLVDCFHGDDENNIFVLAGTHSGSSCNLYRVDSSSPSRPLTLHGGQPDIVKLHGGHTDVVRCLSWDSASQSLVTGGEDSMLCLWKQDDSSSQSLHKDRRKAQKKTKGQHRMKPTANVKTINFT